MFSFKAPASLTQQVSALQVPDSAYGQCVPYVFGHPRIPHKLIYWSNFRSQQQGGKKGKGNTTYYTVNAEMLLGYALFEGIASVWQNQTWFYVNYGSQTFTGSGTNTTFTFNVTANSSSFVMVMGVSYEVTYSETYNDYGGYGITRSFTQSGTSMLPLYNNQFYAPNYGRWQYANLPYATYNATYGSTSVTVTFPTAVTNPVIKVYFCENGGSDQPQNTSNTGKKGGGGLPIQRPGLVFEREMGTGPSGQPNLYPEFSGVAGANIPLGPTPQLPFFNYEAKALFGMGNAAPIASYNPGTGGYLTGTTAGDCCPADILADLICSGNIQPNTTEIWNHGLGFSSFIDTSSNRLYAYSRYGGILKDEPNLWGPTYAGGSNIGLNAVRDYCMSYDIFISGALDSQTSGAQFLDDLCKVANCAPVFDGAGLDFIPYCEVSNYGNGTSYVPPTASGPLFDLTDSDFLPVSGKAPVEQVLSRPSPNYNSLQVGFRDATQQFNSNFVLVADTLDIQVQGSMPGPQENYQFITSSATAQKVGWARLRRNLAIQGTLYRFALPVFWETVLTPMDLITILEPTISDNPIPVRVRSIQISRGKKNRKMTVTAEPFIYGASIPVAPGSTGSPVSNTASPGASAPPGNVNAPIFIETVPALTPYGPELWICVSGAGAAYGGCSIWLSTDGGSDYGPQPIGTVTGRQTMGAVYSANYPNHADPDNTNTLDVDLTQSLGVLTGVSAATQNALGSLWYLAGGGTVTVNGHTLTIPYELGAFQAANLLATNKYGLAPPNRRGVYGTPTAAHPIGSAFSYLNDGLVFRMALTPALIGVTLYFKFTAFNNTGGEQQGLADVSPYTFTPTGLVGFSYDGTGPTGQPYPTGGTNPATSPTTPANDLYFSDVRNVPYVGGQLLFAAIPSRAITIPANMVGSTAKALTAPTGTIQVLIQKWAAPYTSGVTVGTVNFAAGNTIPTFTMASATSFDGVTDEVRYYAPTTADPTFAGLELAVWASRSN